MKEELYRDFTTKLLPKIQEGLILSKEYFTDLFGRYVKYLLIMDSLAAVCGFILVCIGVFFLFKVSEKIRDGEFEDDGMGFVFGMCTFICLIIGLPMFFVNVSLIAKDIYVPEMRVYQEITETKSAK